MRFIILLSVLALPFNAFPQISHASSKTIGVTLQLELGTENIRIQMDSKLDEINISDSNRYTFELKPAKIQTPQSDYGDHILLELRVLQRVGTEKRLLLSSSLVTLNNLRSTTKGNAENGEPYRLDIITRSQ
jgi:hypothetical protein